MNGQQAVSYSRAGKELSGQSSLFRLQNLSDDTFDDILAFLIIDDLFRACVASIAFKKSIRGRTKEADSGPSLVMSDEKLKLMARCFPSSSVVRVPLGGNLTPEAVAELLHALPHLLELEVHGVRWRTAPKGSLLGVIHAYPRAALLDVFPKSNNLRVVRITGTVFLGASELAGLVASSELRVLELRGLRHLNDDGLRQLLEGALVEGGALEGGALEEGGGSQVLGGSEGKSSSSSSSSSKEPSCGNRLEQLLLSDCTCLVELDFPCHALRRLELKNCVNVTSFRRTLPNLLKVDLQFCTSLSDDGVEGLVKLSPCLKELRLMGCSRLTSPHIVAHRLVLLDLSLCSSLTSPCVACRELRGLQLGMGVALQRARLWLPACEALDLRNLPLRSVALHINGALFRTLDLSGCNALAPTSSVTVRLIPTYDAEHSSDAGGEVGYGESAGGGGGDPAPAGLPSWSSSASSSAASSASSSASSSSSSSSASYRPSPRLPAVPTGNEWGDGYATRDAFENGVSVPATAAAVAHVAEAAGLINGSFNGIAWISPRINGLIDRSEETAQTITAPAAAARAAAVAGAARKRARVDEGFANASDGTHDGTHGGGGGDGDDDDGRLHDYDAIVCGTLLGASSFPKLDPHRVRVGGEPMKWDCLVAGAGSTPSTAGGGNHENGAP